MSLLGTGRGSAVQMVAERGYGVICFLDQGEELFILRFNFVLDVVLLLVHWCFVSCGWPSSSPPFGYCGGYLWDLVRPVGVNLYFSYLSSVFCKTCICLI